MTSENDDLRAEIDKEARRVYGEGVYVMQSRAAPGVLAVGAVRREIKVWEETYTEAQRVMLTCLKALPDADRG